MWYCANLLLLFLLNSEERSNVTSSFREALPLSKVFKVVVEYANNVYSRQKDEMSDKLRGERGEG